MTPSQNLKNQCKQLRLHALADHIEEDVMKAETNKSTYVELLSGLFKSELDSRIQKDKERRMKYAALPLGHQLDQYDFTSENTIGKQQLAQLRELKWIEQNYNLILMGPSGTGKTFLAAGLCFDAVAYGYRAYFQTMESLVRILKMKDITRKEAAQYKRICNAHLLIIDDIMMFPVTKEQAVAFFNLINLLHDKTALIITTNKSPKQWAEVLNDTVLTTAILDRILYHCEIVKLSGKSYRMQNRKTIF